MEAAMKLNLQKGSKVSHKARKEWGIGTVIGVETCGTVRVIFKDNREMSIAKGANYLKKVSND
jgi:hypothetical protein